MPFDAVDVAATTIVAAMATEGWKALHAKCARLIKLRKGDEGERAVQRLEIVSQAVGNAADDAQLEHIKQALVPMVLQDLEGVLAEDPGAGTLLAEIVEEAERALAAPRSRRSGNNVVATGNFAMHDNVIVGGDLKRGAGGER